MPFYRYFCQANGKTVEVRHLMGVRLGTWAAVCILAQIDPGDTPGETPVQRLVSRATPMVPRCQQLDKDKPSDVLEL
ncbi:MAG: zinc ribbon domain-containing protein [Candidatus Omnitrophota bacterium]